VTKLCELLIDFKAQGDRVLIFSQFVMVMDILEVVMENLQMKYFRLDGNTDINERQTMIDEFYANEDITVFLLSTKAGGAGINLACANKVIIFDSSFNPQDDIQAENRAHRVGQTRDVEVIRMVTRGTIEEKIYALGETKLALDDRVAGEATPEEKDANLEKAVIAKVEEMLLKEL
jgi:SWI/SNF-related matrix-associated actin-dependent regulator 1 of chromatin subfamily A